MKTATFEQNEDEMSFERFKDIKYKTALELGYNDYILRLIQTATTKNQIYRILKDARNPENMRQKKVESVKKVDDVINKNWTTCFYYKNSPASDKDLKDISDCACLTCVECQSKPDKKCSFYLSKDQYEWGMSKNGSPIPVVKSKQKHVVVEDRKDEMNFNGKRYKKRIPSGLEV